MATDELTATETERERETLVRCVADAFEALKMIPDMDANGPILVWLSEHYLHVRRKESSSPSR